MKPYLLPIKAQGENLQERGFWPKAIHWPHAKEDIEAQMTEDAELQTDCDGFVLIGSRPCPSCILSSKCFDVEC